MKRKSNLLHLSVILTLPLIVCFAGPGTGDYLCGDSNLDGEVNIGDVVHLTHLIFGLGSPSFNPGASDPNYDGSVNIGDVTYLVQYIFKNGAAPCQIDSPPEHEFIFEVMHLNYAWSYDLHGYYIDHEGNIFGYNDNDDDWRWQPDSWTELTAEELQDKYSQNKELIGSVDVATLVEKCRLISWAAQGEMAPPVYQCADFGTTSFMAYVYRNNKYIPVVLHTAGDMASKNLAPEADELYEWLRGVVDGYNTIQECDYPE